MPSVTLTLPQHAETVTRRVVRQLATDMVERFGLPSDMRLVFEEKVGQVSNPEGNLDAESSRALLAEDHIRITYTDQYTEPGILQSAVDRPEYPPIFIDPDLGIEVRSTYARSLLTLQVELVFRDRSVATALQRKLRLRGGLMHHVQYHDLVYQYDFPAGMIAFLHDAHSLREGMYGYGESIKEWFARCFFAGGLVKRTDLAGGGAALGMNESQENIVGRFDQEVFYNELGGTEATYSLMLNYTCEYQQPLGIFMCYPLFVHNQRIPQHYIDAWQPVASPDPEGDAVVSYMDPNRRTAIPRLYKADGGHRLDPLDEWFPEHVVPQTLTHLLVPMLVDPNDPTLLLNLNDLGDELLSGCMREYILAHGNAVLEPYMTPYLIQAWRVGREEEELTLTLSSDGTLRSVVMMSPRQRHYLRIAVMTDFSKLPVDHVVWMRHNPALAHCAFKYLDPNITLDGEGDLNLKTMNGQYITDGSFRDAVKGIITTHPVYRTMREDAPYYIQYSQLTAQGRNR